MPEPRRSEPQCARRARWQRVALLLVRCARRGSSGRGCLWSGQRHGRSSSFSRGSFMPVVASFTYVDANGSAVARIDRVEPGRDGRPKEFLPYLSDGAGGFAERPGLNGTVLPLYHRDEILGCPPETPGFILEGEGKCDVFREALRAGGSAAVTTTIAGGASAPL